MENVLQTNSLTRTIDGKRIVDGISVRIQPHEIVAITGPSGSGKTSFLRLLNRLDEATAGSVLLDGQDYRNVTPRELRRKLGLVLQTPFLFPGTVADNLRFGPAQHDETLDDAAVAGWLDEVGLSGYEQREVSRLSGGEAQRVSIARTLVNHPEVLLMDEPTSALDEDSKEDVEQLVCRLIRQQGLTCLIVTHDAAQAVRLAGRMLVIDQGRLVEDRLLDGAAHA